MQKTGQFFINWFKNDQKTTKHRVTFLCAITAASNNGRDKMSRYGTSRHFRRMERQLVEQSYLSQILTFPWTFFSYGVRKDWRYKRVQFGDRRFKCDFVMRRRSRSEYSVSNRFWGVTKVRPTRSLEWHKLEA